MHTYEMIIKYSILRSISLVIFRFIQLQKVLHYILYCGGERVAEKKQSSRNFPDYNAPKIHTYFK